MKRHLINDGRLKWLAEIIFGSLALLGLIGIPLLNIDLWLAIPIGLVSLFSAGVLMFEGRSAAIGLKPFTDDPLGWRKAKKSYEADAAPTREHGKNTEDF